MHLTILVPNAEKDLGLLLEKEKEKIKTDFSKTGTAIVTLKENKTGIYTIPKVLLKYKRIIPSVNLMETNGPNFGQIISTSDGMPLAPYHVDGGDAYFSIKVAALIFCAKKNTTGEIRVSIDLLTIKQEKDEVFITKTSICRGDQTIPNELIPLAKLAIGKCRCPECNKPHYIKFR